MAWSRHMPSAASDPASLEAEIDRIRAEFADTVDELAFAASPAQLGRKSLASLSGRMPRTLAIIAAIAVVAVVVIRARRRKG